jgi:hypothetical protein
MIHTGLLAKERRTAYKPAVRGIRSGAERKALASAKAWA